MYFNSMGQYFRLQKNNGVFFGEIFPSATLKLKLHTQRTCVRFRYNFIFTLLGK
jgi:hypothetical protein